MLSKEFCSMLLNCSMPLSSNFQLLFPRLLSGSYPTNSCCSPHCGYRHHSSSAWWWGTAKSALISRDKQGLFYSVKMCKDKLIQENNQACYGQNPYMNCQELWSIETSLSFSLCGEYWFWPAFSNINIILCVCHKNAQTKRTASLPIRPLLGRNKLNKQMAYVSHIASCTAGMLSDTLVPSIRLSVELNIIFFFLDSIVTSKIKYELHEAGQMWYPLE